jgi:phage terminase Nu1 subunit (DNA packaging protein)
MHVRKAAFARMRSVSRACVGSWHKRGLLVLDGAGLVDVAASNANLDARADIYRGGRRAVPSNGTEKAAAARKPVGATCAAVDHSEAGHALADQASWTTAEAIRRKETANALIKQLEYEAKAGKLVAEDAVKREWSSILGDVKSGILAVPSRCGARLGHLTAGDIAEIDAEVRAVLAEIGGASVTG